MTTDPGGSAAWSNSRGGQAAAVGRLTVTLAVVVAGQAVLWRAGRALPSVPITSGELLVSLAESDPLTFAVSLLRLVALALGGGLLATTALGLAARACGAARLVAGLNRWTPPTLRNLLDSALGVGLAASIGLGGLPGAAGADPLPPPAVSTLHRLPDASPTTLSRLPDSPPPTTSPIPATSAVPSTIPRSPLTTHLNAPPSLRPEVVLIPRSSTNEEARTREITVQPGDSFWRLAKRHETERLGRKPTAAEIVRYWQLLIALNRDRLLAPDDVDLLFPGQVLLLLADE